MVLPFKYVMLKEQRTANNPQISEISHEVPFVMAVQMLE